MHERVRKDLWGYAAEEHYSNQELIKEKYTGIRPAPGYPSCPEHSVKKEIFKALAVDEIGMSLTENYAMIPASSVSGFYFAHADAQYFDVGKIDEDQLLDLATRFNQSIDDFRKMIPTNLK